MCVRGGHDDERDWARGVGAVALHGEESGDVRLQEGRARQRLGRQLDFDSVVAEPLAQATRDEHEGSILNVAHAELLIGAEAVGANLLDLTFGNLHRVAFERVRTRCREGEQLLGMRNIRGESSTALGIGRVGLIHGDDLIEQFAFIVGRGALPSLKQVRLTHLVGREP